ncbi:MAG: hypothetical protein RM022_009295 [Nostoc sp. EfeVER01]|uniref:hypothetical protein n=1 Tax=Nostoc sp. EfeVER01 TaxID=3075406 RepID=UPI00391C3B10
MKPFSTKGLALKDGIVIQLVKQGVVSEYRKPYQCRHTFITLCLEADIDAKDVGRWVGNSPEIIYKHYAGNKRNLQERVPKTCKVPTLKLIGNLLTY